MGWGKGVLQAKDTLQTAGCVVRRNESSSPERWCVRYRQHVGGKVRHRAIYLGNHVMAERARTLIAGWRAKSDEELRRERLRGIFDQTAVARGYSQRARRRLRAAAEKAFGDPMAELGFVARLRENDADIRLGRRPGRPPTSALW